MSKLSEIEATAKRLVSLKKGASRTFRAEAGCPRSVQFSLKGEEGFLVEIAVRDGALPAGKVTLTAQETGALYDWLTSLLEALDTITHCVLGPEGDAFEEPAPTPPQPLGDH